MQAIVRVNRLVSRNGVQAGLPSRVQARATAGRLVSRNGVQAGLPSRVQARATAGRQGWSGVYELFGACAKSE